MSDLRRWVVAAAASAFLIGLTEAQTQYLISTNAGGLPAPTSALATSYAFPNPNAVATDAFGHIYFSTNSHCVFRLDPGGQLTRVAGTCQAGFSGDGQSAVKAQLNTPEGVAVDAAGNLYIADLANNRVRQVTPAGIINTVAGTGVAGFSGDGVAATASELNNPQGLAIDTAGNLYIADQGNNRIRKVSPGGTITTVAGSGASGSSGDGGPATSATLKSPVSLALDAAGNLYVGDASYQVRKITAGGTIFHIAGVAGVSGFLGDTGPAATARLGFPAGLAADAAGNVYITDQFALRVRKIDTTGIINTYAGGGSNNPGDGGQATSGELFFPAGLAVDFSGDLYITDQDRVRKVNASGTISTVAGNGSIPFGGDGGLSTLGQFDELSGIGRDGNGNIYVADILSCRVRKISVGVVSTIAGTGVCGNTGDGLQATNAEVQPYALAADPAGNVYIDGRAVVRQISTTGVISTVAGTGTPGFSGDNTPATTAQLSLLIRGLAVSNGNVYLSDLLNERVRKVIPGGNITTVAGDGTPNFFGDGGLATAAELNSPTGLAVDTAGNLYIADFGNNRVRKVAVDGTISTVAGNGTAGTTGDGGLAINAEIDGPNAVAVDAAGNLFIATHGNNIRVVTGGIINTIAGTGINAYTGDGALARTAQIANPLGLITDPALNLYVADSVNGAVRILEPAGTEPLLEVTSTHADPFTAGQPGSYTVTVSNAAQAAPTTSVVTVTETVPASLTLQPMSGVGWTCFNNTCTNSTVLANGNSYAPITVPVTFAGNPPPQATNLVTVSGGGSPQASSADPTFIINSPSPVLEIAVTHAGKFVSGGQGTYTIFVDDQAASAATNGTAVTVTENVPAPLTLVSMSGPGWICPSNTCSRSDVLTGGAGYNPITVTVTVPKNAPSPVINQVTVSGGGSASANASDTTIISALSCDANGDGSPTVADVQLVINEALGIAAAVHDLNSDGKVNIADVQIVINAALSLGCPL